MLAYAPFALLSLAVKENLDAIKIRRDTPRQYQRWERGVQDHEMEKQCRPEVAVHISINDKIKHEKRLSE